MKLIDGKKLAKEITNNLPKKQKKIAFVLVGENKESEMYISMKEKMARQLKVEVLHCKPPATISKDELKDTITALCKHVDGLMVQLPLPESLQEYTQEILDCIDPAKDIDALNTKAQFISPFIQSITESLKTVEHPSQKELKTVILARSQVFKDRLAKQLQLQLGITNIAQQEDTKNLTEYNCIISVLGCAGEITEDDIAQDAICIDAGLKVVVGSARGDFHSNINEKAYAKTPVPGGVGPLTIACLFRNLLEK